LERLLVSIIATLEPVATAKGPLAAFCCAESLDPLRSLIVVIQNLYELALQPVFSAENNTTFLAGLNYTIDTYNLALLNVEANSATLVSESGGHHA
jgi:hypothetical protein